MLESLFFVSLLTLNLTGLRSQNVTISFDGASFIQSNYYEDDWHSGIFYDLYFNELSPQNGYSLLHLSSPDNTTMVHPNINNFPNATLISNFTSSHYYNCHSFAWLYEGSLNYVPTNTNELYWLNSPYYLYKPLSSNPVKCISSFSNYTSPSSIEDSSFINTGDIIVYYDVVDPDGPPIICHSAVVIQTSSTISQIVVRSKWREYGIYEHKIFECPYYSPANFAGGLSNVETPIDVCHINHTYTHSTNNLYHIATSLCCGKTIREPHSFVMVGRRFVCSICGYISMYEPYNNEWSE